jgi:hypothetical protein
VSRMRAGDGGKDMALWWGPEIRSQLRGCPRSRRDFSFPGFIYIGTENGGGEKVRESGTETTILVLCQCNKGQGDNCEKQRLEFRGEKIPLGTSAYMYVECFRMVIRNRWIE